MPARQDRQVLGGLAACFGERGQRADQPAALVRGHPRDDAGRFAPAGRGGDLLQDPHCLRRTQ
jgi:hypothetical protein